MQPLIDVLGNSFEGMLSGVITFIPNLIIALIILLIGWIVGVSFEKVIVHFFKVIKVDTFLEESGIGRFFHRADIGFNLGLFVGALIKWFFIITFLMASFEVVGLTEVNSFLRNVVLTYIPQVIIATLILVVSSIAAGLMQRIVVSSAKTINLETAHLLGTITSWAIWIFGFIFALAQLGIAADFMRVLFTGIVAMLALAGGLAFGLGGRDSAAHFIEKIRSDITLRRKV